MVDLRCDSILAGAHQYELVAGMIGIVSVS